MSEALQVAGESWLLATPVYAGSLIATGHFVVLGLSRELTVLAPQAIRGMRQAVPSLLKYHSCWRLSIVFVPFS